MSEMWEYSESDITTLRIVEKLRRSYGMSQAELARRAKVSRKTVMDIESGAVDPRLSSILAITQQLGISLVPTFIGLPGDEK